MSSGIGYGADVRSSEERRVGAILREVEPDDLLKFGGLGFSFDSATAIGASLMREPYMGAQGRPWIGIPPRCPP